MTLQSQHVTVVIAARIGQAPIYPQIGQGLLGGTIELVMPGDSVSQHKQLNELRLVFEREFFLSDLTAPALQLQLWQAHWYRASRKAMQRAADMLVLAAASGIAADGKLSRECEGLAQALDIFVNARPKDHPIGAALLRGESIPAGDGVRRQEIESSALRADGIRPSALLTSEETQALAEQISSTADAVRALGVELAELDAQGADDAGSTVGADDSPFRLYGFAHEMHELLKRINIKVAGRDAVYSHGMQPSEQMLAEADSAMEAVWVLLDKIAGRGPLETDPEAAEALEGMISNAMVAAANLEPEASPADLRNAMANLQAQIRSVCHAGNVSAKRSYEALERLERGLMALANAIGPMATDQMLAAMERPV